MKNNDKDMIRIGDVLREYVPNSKDRERLAKTRDVFTQFVSRLGPDFTYSIKDSLEEIIVSFCLKSDYRGRHSIEFFLKCSIDDVYFESRFKTPRLHDGIGGEESLASELFMEVHTDEMGVYRDDFDPESDEYIRWTIDIYPDETEITEQMIPESYNRLVKASTYIIQKMESAYWNKYTMSNLSPDKMWREANNAWSYLYEVFEGTTVTGNRAYFIEDDYGEVFIDKHDSLTNKVYIGHYSCYPIGPDEEFEDVKEIYEIETDGDDFFIMDTTMRDVPQSRVIGEGGRVTDTDFIYCNFKNHDDCNSTYIIEMNQNETTHIYELEEYGEFTEIAKIEKLDQTKPYIDIAETQMNANYKVSARFNDVERIAFIYAIQFLSIYRVEKI